MRAIDVKLVTTCDVQNDLKAVVLVHGLGGKQALMKPLARRLENDGYQVHCWTYRSYFGSIENHAAGFADWMATTLPGDQDFHIVAHSMGCIVVRAALDRFRPPKLQRVVLLAPPNQGSPLASIASRFFGRLIPLTSDLATRPTSYVCQLPSAEGLEIGILAARYDWLIPATHTRLVGQKQHQVVGATHNSLLLSRAAWLQMKNFLRTGAFQA